MLTDSELMRLVDIKPQLEPNLDYGIGIVGAGHIVNWAHLPAYRKAGFNVVGIFDLAKDKAVGTAQKYEVPKVYDSLDELLADPAVEVVDMALAPTLNLRIGEQVIAAKKHFMCHKPMTTVYAEAVKLVEDAKRANVKFAVNQNLRWDPAMWACRRLIRADGLGKPVAGFIDHAFGGDLGLLGETFPPWYGKPLRHLYQKEKEVYVPPEAKPPPGPTRGSILGDGVHIIDSLKVFFGVPKSVMANITGTPANPKADTVNTLVLKYRDDFSITMRLSYNNWWGDSHLKFSFEGTDSIIRGDIGDYRRDFFKEGISPNDRLEIGVRVGQVKWVIPPFRGTWIPDAFQFSMGELLKAIKHNTEPETSGADNLSTLRIIHAALDSAESGKAVDTA
jgi:predicted dehydrogenase